MGGFSLGFHRLGFATVGFDLDNHAVRSYLANIGTATVTDIRQLESVIADVIIGGPPCRPWSALNLARRGNLHPDYSLIRAFQELLMRSLPKVFAMENVPLLRNDRVFQELLNEMKAAGYDCQARLVRYSDYGASTSRKRLVTLGTLEGSVSDIWASVESAASARVATVGEAISSYVDLAPDPGLDHHWPNLRTIAKYEAKYASGQYGWYRLAMERPAPSFGNVMKTYTLHPFFKNGHRRVVSPREVMAILGFDDNYVFPDGVPLGAKYRMVADAVSPSFSTVLATAVHTALVAQRGE